MSAGTLTNFRNRSGTSRSAFRCRGGRPAAVQTAGHERELKVESDLHRHSGGQRVHVEEVDGVGDGILDDHAPGVAVDELAHGGLHPVGEQQRRLLTAQPAHVELADVPGIPEMRTTLFRRTCFQRHCGQAAMASRSDPERLRRVKKSMPCWLMRHRLHAWSAGSRTPIPGAVRRCVPPRTR